MVVVHREAGMRIVIYVDDHDPPHVHVIGQGGEMKVFLFGPEGRPVMDYSIAMKTNDRRRAMDVIERHSAEFHQRWQEIHRSE